MRVRSDSHVVVIGGGVIGLGIAVELVSRGLQTTVFDPAPGTGATHAAAGMLAPVAEARWGDVEILPLALASIRLWKDFATRLEACSGIDVDLHADGILLAGVDSGDKAILDDLLVLHERQGLAASGLSSRETRDLEPQLAPGVRAGVLAADDMAVDPRRVVAAQLTCLERSGGHVDMRRVASVDTRGEAATGVILEDGTRVPADGVVLAAGAASTDLGGIPPDSIPDVRPVKGQVLRLHGPRLLERPVHGIVHGTTVYLVPRSHGEVVVGATQEEMGFDPRPTGRGVYELLRDAMTLVPEAGELELREITVGFRPGTPDNLPIIGSGGLDGLVVATGHHRNGILLAPATAEIVGDVITTGRLAPEWQRYAPTRPALNTREVVRS